MRRTRALGRNFAVSVSRAGVKSGEDKARALVSTMGAICEAKALPMHCDFRVTVPPVREAWVRRVTGNGRSYNLWLHFQVNDDEVLFTFVASTPPVPAYDDDE